MPNNGPNGLITPPDLQWCASRRCPKAMRVTLAAVVRTLPEAEQQMIEAAVDRLLKERGL